MNKNWSNTALVAYSAIPKIVQQLDRAIKTRVNSTFQSKHLKMGISNECLISEILEIIDEKRRLVNLYWIVGEALNKLDNADKQLLILRTQTKLTFQSISKQLDISLRTVFRRLANAEDSFAAALRRNGYGEDWLERVYSNDKYILPIYERLNEEKYSVAKNL